MTTSLAVGGRISHRPERHRAGAVPNRGAWSRLMPSKPFEEHVKDKHPMKRFGKHEELANLAHFSSANGGVHHANAWYRRRAMAARRRHSNDLLLLPEAAWEADGSRASKQILKRPTEAARVSEVSTRT